MLFALKFVRLNMARYDDKRWLKLFAFGALVFACFLAASEAGRSHENLTACQHLRRAEARRSKTLQTRVRAPRCDKRGQFETIQCANARRNEDCWCVDEYGVEIPGTRNVTKATVKCKEPDNCPASACRMFCASGFTRDPQTGCSQCHCRDPCDGINCPNGQSCQLMEVKCKAEPCPPVPTCKKARSLANFCPAGTPLALEDGSNKRPFLCGLEPGKPQCPPLYQCMVEGANDYGVCCPSSLKFNKPGTCPAPEMENYTPSTGYMCGTPCTHDLECRNMEKCCFTKGCKYNCQQPHNVTTCQQAKALSDILAINEREGRGYVPDCSGPNDMFSPKQCSRNGLVCWCVDPRTGHKIPSSMGAAKTVNCEGWENMISRSFMGRSFNNAKCDTNICAAVCEYGFKNDHNNCPTCECSEPCEGFLCPIGSHCEVATDSACKSGSSLCSSWPVCKPSMAYSNPCEVGTPLSDNLTNELMYCYDESQNYGREMKSFFDADTEYKLSRSMSNRIVCPKDYKCTKLHGEPESVCCPTKRAEQNSTEETHPQTMCEYIRDFSERMEGTEEGMKLALPKPHCTEEGSYKERQCTYRKIKVTRAEHRKVLEENTIRRMRMLLANSREVAKRSKRNAERLKLYRVDDSLLKVQVAAPITGRNAKVIAMGASKQQGFGELFETEFKKIVPAPKRPFHDDEIVELDVEECWCVDSFGTEIPHSRGFNVTDEACVKLREEIDCLDLTCRMGCEYGFNLDPITRCPACQCRDPCQDVVCGENEECRIVEVSCDDEYCPPVPACLARKPGQCPYLVPPGPDNLDANACAYECRTDSHCDGTKRCCSNGCGTQCVLPQMKTACQHLQAIQMHQSSELGIPVMKMNIAQCDVATGEWNKVQCSPNGECWCVDSNGQELSGTRVKGAGPVCKENSSFKCEKQNCSSSCEAGYQVDANGCQTCECKDFCAEINCGAAEECQLVNIDCVDSPCPKMPICVPKRESLCAEGTPLKQGDMIVSCGPHNENETCPSSHTCQLNPVTHRGVCCTKTRDVCFESMDNTCLAKTASVANATRYRFYPKANRCIAVVIDLKENNCQTKNLFHNELSCNSVCPALTQCERLKLKNTLAAHRTGHSSVWFKPRCDPITGHWSPVQCLGKQPNLNSAIGSLEQTPPSPYGVCWCADKKGAPLKGTLTRDIEPVCNSRQGRKFKTQNTSDLMVMEELIRQMTVLTDFDNFLDNEERDSDEAQARNIKTEDILESIPDSITTVPALQVSVTERVAELANSLWDSKLHVDSVKPIPLKTTRCRSLATTAPFPISCNENGSFSPMQCNKKHCWCVDSAGNQLESSPMFEKGQYNCTPTPISSVIVEMHMQNNSVTSISNVYDSVRTELNQLLGRNVENLRVQENADGTALIHFELHNDDKIDMAFAIETAIMSGDFKLSNGHYSTDITRVQFIHRREEPPTYAKVVISHEGTIQLVLFITASSTALLICIFVVYFMMKRGKEKGMTNPYLANSPPPYQSRKSSLTTDNDFASPIFVLSPEHDLESIRPPYDNQNLEKR